MSYPLVSIVCLCYNHEDFVRESIESVLNQSYPNIEIIAIDDASRDRSAAIIRDLVEKHSTIRYLQNERNIGICGAFNRALSVAKGDFIVDFATDDVMLPDRIDLQVRHFLSLDESYGVVFTDALYVNGQGKILSRHYEHLKRKGLLSNVPQGDVYRNLISDYFICSPTMMTRRSVFETLGGYDEALAYEDFDFWIRSSRNFKYAFLDAVTTKVRKLSGSMSTGWYHKGDKQLHSTYLVCRKCLLLNRNEGDRLALTKRILFEIRQSVFSENYREAELFYSLLKEVGAGSVTSDLYMLLAKLKLPLSFFRRMYHRFRYGF